MFDSMVSFHKFCSKKVLPDPPARTRRGGTILLPTNSMRHRPKGSRLSIVVKSGAVAATSETAILDSEGVGRCWHHGVGDAIDSWMQAKCP